MGKLDNTLIIFIVGDNGTSAEGSMLGTPFDMAAIQGVNVPVADQLKFYDVWGSDKTTPHMAVGWTWAFDTPFKWTKQVASHFGGTRNGLVISWPGHIKDVGAIRTQFHHVIDIVPTILEATGIQAPLMVNGIAQKPIEGVSMAYTFDKANANAPSRRETQYFEMVGNRAIYHDGWIAATTPPEPPWGLGMGKFPDVVNGYTWELYNLAQDYSEYNDLAAQDARQAARHERAIPVGGREIQACFHWTTASSRARSAHGRAIPREGPSSITLVYRTACLPAMPPTSSASPTPSLPRWKFPTAARQRE